MQRHFLKRKESLGPGFQTDCRRVHVDWRCVAKRICAWSSSLVTDPRTCGMSCNVSQSYIDCLICFFCDVFCLTATWSVNSLCICMSGCYSLSNPTRAVCLSGRVSISHTFLCIRVEIYMRIDGSCLKKHQATSRT